MHLLILPKRTFHFPLYIGGSNKDKVLPAYDGTPNYWRGVPSTTMLSGDWKLIYYYEYDSFELFNLKDDISEKHDLSEVEPEIAQGGLFCMILPPAPPSQPVPNVLN